MIRLFIQNKELDLDESVQIAITKQFEDLSNPTSIINDWSKTVSIPFTAKNHQIFGHIYCPDKLIVDGGTTGIYFNPLLKLDFRLEWDDAVLMTGYAKMNEIKQSEGRGTYELTLFGQLGKIFQEMKKITFNTTTDETNYLIDGSEYVDEYINKELIGLSWNSAGQQHEPLVKKGQQYYSVTDLIGFAPNNAFSEGFDYKTFQTGEGTSKTFTEVLETANFYDATGIEPDTAIPDGLLPREIGEYRSYLQLPFIYFNKLFKIFQAKAESVTGYTFELDTDWFDANNPYWYNLVYMLRPLSLQKATNYPVYAPVSTNTSSQRYNLVIPVSAGYTYAPAASTRVETPFQLTESNEAYDADTDLFSFNSKSIKLDGNVAHLFHIEDPDGALRPTYAKAYFDGRVLVDEMCILDENDNQIASYKFAICSSSYTGDLSSYISVINVDEINFSAKDEFTLNNHFNLSLNEGIIGIDKFRVKFKSYFDPADPVYATASFCPFTFTVYGDPQTAGTLDVDYWSLDNSFSSLSLNVVTEFVSGSHFTLNDLWNNDYNLFDEIINYCKIYRISIRVDEFNKKIIFEPFTDYFSRYTVTDWTRKIDKSKDFNITPITFDSKYVLFNYKDSDTQIGKEYKEKYGVNIGDYRLITEYNFNTNTTELFKNVTPSIVNTDNVLSWSNLYDYKQIVYSFPAEIYVYNKDADKKQQDIFGAYFFYNGLADFSDEEALHLRSVFITDDTTFQQSNNTYFYTQGAEDSKRLRIVNYPKLDVTDSKNICLFNTPKENYTYKSNYAGKNSIYANLWKGYIDERYNVQNKKITCYVRLTPADYNNFDFNKFVRIGNQLCIVNKIYDYDITINQPTKVDLITIQDIKGYTDNDYDYDYIHLSAESLTIPYDHYKRVIVNASSNWEVKADDWSDFLTVGPTSGPSGATEVLIGTLDENNGYKLTFDLLDENEEEVIAQKQLPVAVGGTATIDVNPWFTDISKNSSANITVTSGSPWKIIDQPVSSELAYLGPTSSSAATQVINIVSGSTATIETYYLENEAGDIQSFRVRVNN